MHLTKTKEAGKLLPNSYWFLRFSLGFAKAGVAQEFNLQQCVGVGSWPCVEDTGAVGLGDLHPIL